MGIHCLGIVRINPIKEHYCPAKIVRTEAGYSSGKDINGNFYHSTNRYVGNARCVLAEAYVAYCADETLEIHEKVLLSFNILADMKAATIQSLT